MVTKRNAIAAIDRRSFFEQALAYGAEYGILTEPALNKIRTDGGKGLVQIANFFGTAHLQANLESSAIRMINLISLFLETQSASDLQRAAISLRDNSLLSHSKGGSEMLKRLHAMPVSTFLSIHPVSANEEKTFLNERSFASPLTATEYKEAVAGRQHIQNTIDFAGWVAKQMQAKFDDYSIYSAEEFIHSAMLVWYVGREPFQIPTESSFVKLLTEIRKTSFKPKFKQFERVLEASPKNIREMAQSMMQGFTHHVLPEVRSIKIKPIEFIHGDRIGVFCFRTNLDEDVGELDKLVAKEWVRITKGNQDPENIAAILLLIATGQAPKSTLLKKEATAIITTFRASGFNSEWVHQFIDTHVPYPQQGELTEMWNEDILPEAQTYLSDPDQNDVYMDRALEFMRETCAAKWKAR